MSKLKKDDIVMVLVGKDRKKTGAIVDISYKKNMVRVKGLCLVKKHTKPRRKGEVGAINVVESYIHISNVLPVDKLSGKVVRHKTWNRDNK